jgi:uncharacterized protein (DUF1697 family)
MPEVEIMIHMAAGRICEQDIPRDRAASPHTLRTNRMSRYVELLRAANVGGTGKLPMTDLKAICDEIGFSNVRTYIASGNVVFDDHRNSQDVKVVLESRLEAYAGRPVGVLVRTGQEMAAILASNPFMDKAPSRTVAIFLDEAPPYDALEHASGLNGEHIQLGEREIYVYYGDGMATSKLKILAAKKGTARNMNTVAKLVEMATAPS